MNFQTLVTFVGLGLAVVWGTVPPHGVDDIADLRFVVAIEPSGDRIGPE
jgi:hypothetical protein